MLEKALKLLQSMEPTKPMLWDTRDHARYNVRVLCDKAGLSVMEKNILCACIHQESNFNNNAVCRNRDKDGNIMSSDWGIVQINDHYHIGAGKDFPSVEYVVANPDKAVQWMIDMYKKGQLKMWVSYSSGAYKQWLQEESLPGVPY